MTDNITITQNYCKLTNCNLYQFAIRKPFISKIGFHRVVGIVGKEMNREPEENTQTSRECHFFTSLDEMERDEGQRPLEMTLPGWLVAKDMKEE